MHRKSTTFGEIGVCAVAAGSSAAAMKIQKTLEKSNIPASVSKSTTASGCVYVVSFPCIYRESVENILSSSSIKHHGYL